MMKIRIAALAVGMLCQAALADGSLPMRGFRGLLWGDPPAHLGPAELVQREGEVRCYRRLQENLLFGDNALRTVHWCFHRDRLFQVQIEAHTDLDSLRAEFERGYGPPDERSPVTARWGDAQAAVSAELAASAPGAPARLRLQAREFAPVRP